MALKSGDVRHKKITRMYIILNSLENWNVGVSGKVLSKGGCN